MDGKTANNNHNTGIDGADFGDFISFTAHMKQQAKAMGVDLLLVDTGKSI